MQGERREQAHRTQAQHGDGRLAEAGLPGRLGRDVVFLDPVLCGRVDEESAVEAALDQRRLGADDGRRLGRGGELLGE